MATPTHVKTTSVVSIPSHKLPPLTKEQTQREKLASYWMMVLDPECAWHVPPNMNVAEVRKAVRKLVAAKRPLISYDDIPEEFATKPLEGLIPLGQYAAIHGGKPPPLREIANAMGVLANMSMSLDSFVPENIMYNTKTQRFQVVHLHDTSFLTELDVLKFVNPDDDRLKPVGFTAGTFPPKPEHVTKWLCVRLWALCAEFNNDAETEITSLVVASFQYGQEVVSSAAYRLQGVNVQGMFAGYFSNEDVAALQDWWGSSFGLEKDAYILTVDRARPVVVQTVESVQPGSFAGVLLRMPGVTKAALVENGITTVEAPIGVKATITATPVLIKDAMPPETEQPEEAPVRQQARFSDLSGAAASSLSLVSDGGSGGSPSSGGEEEEEYEVEEDPGWDLGGMETTQGGVRLL